MNHEIVITWSQDKILYSKNVVENYSLYIDGYEIYGWTCDSNIISDFPPEYELEMAKNGLFDQLRTNFTKLDEPRKFTYKMYKNRASYKKDVFYGTISDDELNEYKREYIKYIKLKEIEKKKRRIKRLFKKETIYCGCSQNCLSFGRKQPF